MSKKTMIMSYAAGVLAANSLPHLATATTGNRLLTPLAGEQSDRWVNLLWSGMNLAAGLGLLAAGSRGNQQLPWPRQLRAFEAGVLSFSVWGVIYEVALNRNHDDG